MIMLMTIEGQLIDVPGRRSVASSTRGWGRCASTARYANSACTLTYSKVVTDAPSMVTSPGPSKRIVIRVIAAPLCVPLRLVMRVIPVEHSLFRLS